MRPEQEFIWQKQCTWKLQASPHCHFVNECAVQTTSPGRIVHRRNNSCERIIHCYTALVKNIIRRSINTPPFFFTRSAQRFHCQNNYSFVITRSHCLNKASAMQKQYSINPSRIPTQSRCQLVSRVNTRVKEQRRGLCCFPTYPNPISACNFHCRLSPSPTAWEVYVKAACILTIILWTRVHFLPFECCLIARSETIYGKIR